jgi:hypothetical protein
MICYEPPFPTSSLLIYFCVVPFAVADAVDKLISTDLDSRLPAWFEYPNDMFFTFLSHRKDSGKKQPRFRSDLNCLLDRLGLQTNTTPSGYIRRMRDPSWIAHNVLDTVGVGLQITNSACNLAITALLGVSLKASEATRSYFIVHVVIVALSALAIAGVWVGAARDTSGVPHRIRHAPGLLLFPISIVIYQFIPGLCVRIMRGTNTSSTYVPVTTKAKTRALREEELELLQAARLNKFFNNLAQLTKDSHIMVLLQVGFEGVPLLLAQLVMAVEGFLDDSSHFSGEAAQEGLKVLVYVSMASVVLQLAFRAYMICRSFDPRVFCLKWLFCLYDLTTMLYMIVFLTTIGKPFASFKQLAAGDFSGGYGLSQVWMVGYLLVIGMMTMLLLLWAIGDRCKYRTWRSEHTAILLLGIVGFGPFVCIIFGVKLIGISLFSLAMEPYTATLPSTGGVPVMFLFGFLRKGDWDERFQYICRNLHDIVKAQEVRPTFLYMKDSIRHQWIRLFPGSVGDDLSLRSNQFLPRSYRQLISCSGATCNQLMLRIPVLIFVVFQLFTVVFPFASIYAVVEAARTGQAGATPCVALFVASVAELVMMIPLLPRFGQYVRFLVQCSKLADFSHTLGSYYHYKAPLNNDGKPVSIIEAAIQAYYTPPHEYVIVRMIQDGSAAQTFLPYDIISYLSTFSDAPHLDLTGLTREEAVSFRLEAAADTPSSVNVDPPQILTEKSRLLS